MEKATRRSRRFQVQKDEIGADFAGKCTCIVTKIPKFPIADHKKREAHTGLGEVSNSLPLPIVPHPPTHAQRRRHPLVRNKVSFTLMVLPAVPSSSFT